MQDKIKELLESLAGSNMKVTITFEPAAGLTAEQVEEARKKGRQGQDIYFYNADLTL